MAENCVERNLPKSRRVIRGCGPTSASILFRTRSARAAVSLGAQRRVSAKKFNKSKQTTHWNLHSETRLIWRTSRLHGRHDTIRFWATRARR